jgi:protein-L-isoaspartate(D-aspartate) O-methyltransferase
MGKVRDVLVCGAAALFGSNAVPAADDDRADERTRMVEQQMAGRDIDDARVLEAMRRVPRHRFVPERERRYAYSDTPLPIGEDQTISQPYIVALMTQLVRPTKDSRALEVGTGSGYQAAVLAELVDHVFTIELEPTLAMNAQRVLKELGYENITVRTGDGYAGWPDRAPFDIIVVTAAPDHIPPSLLDQLKPSGRMIVPVGPSSTQQQLQLIEKDAAGKTHIEMISPVRFVPLRRDAGERTR